MTTPIKKYITSQLADIESQIEQITAGITARSTLTEKLKKEKEMMDKLKDFCKEVHGSVISTLEEADENLEQKIEENLAVLENLRNYCDDYALQLQAYELANSKI